MRTAIILLSALLFFWIAGSSYHYVCKIRKDCRKDTSAVIIEIDKSASSAEAAAGEKITETTDSLQSVTETPVIPKPPAYSFYFEFNSTVCGITAESISHFALVKNYLSANASSKVMVAGHSDAIGPEWAKKKISGLRADFIKQKLEEAGINPEIIITSGESDLKPASDNTTSEGRARNRRTEIVIQ
ncbi:MAG: OmpA family protein [Bacteroidales bacterium]|nr:OmpA family protein [Bacteroidales bacterium]